MSNQLGWSSPSCPQLLSTRSFKPPKQAEGDFQAELMSGTKEHHPLSTLQRSFSVGQSKLSLSLQRAGDFTCQVKPFPW